MFFFVNIQRNAKQNNTSCNDLLPELPQDHIILIFLILLSPLFIPLLLEVVIP